MWSWLVALICKLTVSKFPMWIWMCLAPKAVATKNKLFPLITDIEVRFSDTQAWSQEADVVLKLRSWLQLVCVCVGGVGFHPLYKGWNQSPLTAVHLGPDLKPRSPRAAIHALIQQRVTFRPAAHLRDPKESQRLLWWYIFISSLL